jgi:hypothetical protein
VLEATAEVVGRSALSFVKVHPRNYAVDAALFYLMEESNRRRVADPAGFPTKYVYFNQQMSRALIEGRCEAGFTVSESIAAMENVHWPRQLAIARSHHLTLRQYEGGCGLAGEGLLNGDPRSLVYGGNEQFGEYVFNFGHSDEAAAAYAKNFSAFWRTGGEYPAKFIADGRSSNAGTWAGVRYWPLQANKNESDAGNPVWAVTLAANAGILGRK